MCITEIAVRRFSINDVKGSRIHFLNYMNENCPDDIDIFSENQYKALKLYTMGYLLRDRHGQATKITRRPAWFAARFDPIIGLDIKINERNLKHANLFFEVADELLESPDRERIQYIANNLSLAIVIQDDI